MLAGEVENFEQLSAATRVALLIGSALLIGLALNRYRPGARRVGVVHVMERLTLHQGKLPLKNAVIQFFGGALALIAGQSGGREGPAIHLGATAASLLGQASKLPNNSLRTMVACGTAAAIASSFNTPIAGVIFALEVVMMEYAIASFIPIIVAAVTSTLITRFFFGADPAFIIDPFHLYTSFEIFYLVLGGILIGCISAAYVQLIQLFARLSLQPLWLRIALAGAITATVAIFIPEVMGVGYDTVDRIMITDLGVLFLVALLIGKTITSAAAVGLGMPVGLIGPTLFMGATVGGMLGSILINWHGIDTSIGFFCHFRYVRHDGRRAASAFGGTHGGHGDDRKHRLHPASDGYYCHCDARQQSGLWPTLGIHHHTEHSWPTVPTQPGHPAPSARRRNGFDGHFIFAAVVHH